MPAAFTGVILLTVSLPSVSRISSRWSTSLDSKAWMARPMASPSAVCGPAMATSMSCTSAPAVARSRVKGSWI